MSTGKLIITQQLMLLTVVPAAAAALLMAAAEAAAWLWVPGVWVVCGTATVVAHLRRDRSASSGKAKL